mmetsp:Transcript_24218/g.46937  ORF Transcript_24218/g.46937 Transcript_24218/m.46937 type:complete len:203 (-) Transcript_24218:93-701(-)
MHHPRFLEPLGPAVLGRHASPLGVPVGTPLYRGVVCVLVHVALKVAGAHVHVPEALWVRLWVPCGIGHAAVDVDGPPVSCHALVVQCLTVASGAVPLVGTELGVVGRTGRRDRVLIVLQVSGGSVLGKDREGHVVKLRPPTSLRVAQPRHVMLHPLLCQLVVALGLSHRGKPGVLVYPLACVRLPLKQLRRLLRGSQHHCRH